MDRTLYPQEYRLIPRKLIPGLYALGTLAFLLPLGLLGYIGLFTRYVADDYETAGAVAQYGLLGAQQYWYTHWSGRFSYFFLVSLFELFAGIRAVPLLAFACLGLWLAAAALILFQLGRLASLPHPGYLALLGSAGFIFVTLRGQPNLYQTLFWVTGLLTYVFYLILLCFAAALLIYQLNRRGRKPALGLEMAAAALIMLVLGGMAEISAALDVAILGVGLAYFLLRRADPRRAHALAVLGAALAAALVALAVLVAAPGNAFRQALAPPPPPLDRVAVRSVLNPLIYLGSNWLSEQARMAGLIFILPLVAGLVSGSLERAPAQFPWRGLLASAAGLFFLLMAIFATVFYAQTAFPVARVLVIPNFLVTSFSGAASFLAGRSLGGVLRLDRPLDRAGAAAALLLLAASLVLGLGNGAYRMARLLGPAQARAAEWDRRDRQIRAAARQGEKDITVEYIRDLTRLGDYSSDPTFLVNRAAAAYYGVHSIVALDKVPEP